MKYNVTLFETGHQVLRGVEIASTPKQAARLAANKHYGSFEHARVEGNKVWRYDRRFKPIKKDGTLFKAQVGAFPALLLMVGNFAEFTRFNTQEKRDSTYEELCTISTSAESASPDPAQTDTTASSGETSGSKSGLTFLKISNGSVMNATWLDTLTRLSTGKSSGKDKYVVSVKKEWSPGSTPSRSKSDNGIFWATVKPLPDPDDARYPGVNSSMLKLVGTTIEVRVSPLSTKAHTLYFGEGAHWLPEWLDFEHVTAVLSPEGRSTDGLYIDSAMKQYAGQTHVLTKCPGFRPAHYKALGFCWSKEWLKIGVKWTPNTLTAKVKDIPVGTQYQGVVFVPYMLRYVGKTLTFDQDPDKPWLYTYRGWRFSKSWLFTGESGNTFFAKVKDDLKPGITASDGVYFAHPMRQYIGKILEFRKGKGAYLAEGWSWSREWLERIKTEEEKMSKYAKLPISAVKWDAVS